MSNDAADHSGSDRPVTRDEFKSEIGRIEAVLNARLGNLKAWGIAALVGGQAAAGLLAAAVGPHKAAQAAIQIIRSL